MPGRIKNPNFRAPIDTNPIRTLIDTEVKRDPKQQFVTFDEIRNSDPSLRNLTDGDILEITTAQGLESFLE